MGSDKDDRDVALVDVQLILKLEAAHPRQVNVQDQTRSVIEAFGSEEFLGRRESIRMESHGPHEALQCLAYRRIVIHDRDAPGRGFPCYRSRCNLLRDLHLVLW